MHTRYDMAIFNNNNGFSRAVFISLYLLAITSEAQYKERGYTHICYHKIAMYYLHVFTLSIDELHPPNRNSELYLS